jgi:hypothetical protein
VEAVVDHVIALERDALRGFERGIRNRPQRERTLLGLMAWILPLDDMLVRFLGYHLRAK